MASRYSVEPAKLLETLKNTAFKNANDSQMMALVIVANEYGLNPFTKQIYAFPDKGGGIVPVVSVDGWIKMMNAHPDFDGIEFEFDEKDGKPVSCTATIYVKGRSRPVRVTEYFSECQRNTDPWRISPMRMLRHKALIQGARVAFGLGGVHDEDEGEIIAGAKVISGSVVEKPKFTPAPEVAQIEDKAIEQPAVEPEPVNAPEPEQESAQVNAPASERVQTPPPLEEQDRLIVWLNDELVSRDLDVKAVIAICKARKWCGTATNIGEMPASGRVKLAGALDEITREIGG